MLQSWSFLLISWTYESVINRLHISFREENVKERNINRMVIFQTQIIQSTVTESVTIETFRMSL
jgi:hypothetical protein